MIEDIKEGCSYPNKVLRRVPYKIIPFIAIVSILMFLVFIATASAQTNSTAKDIQISIVPGSRSASNAKFYDPSPANVSIGSSVTWTNNDNTYHTVTSGIGPNSASVASLFDSGYLSPSQTFMFTFSKSGTFDYFCFIHPFMKGQIIVSQ
jgi:plastocyanin